MIFFEPKNRDRKLFPHDPFKGVIVPRPIGWVSNRRDKMHIRTFTERAA